MTTPEPRPAVQEFERFVRAALPLNYTMSGPPGLGIITAAEKDGDRVWKVEITQMAGRK